MKQLLNNLKYGAGNTLVESDIYVITKPMNTWDTNYRLFDEQNNTVYLIDCDDVQRNENDLNEYGGILYSDLLELNIETIVDNAWKIEEMSVNRF